MSTELHVADRKEWRAWLRKNHRKTDEIWLVYYKKTTGKPCVDYTDSVEEALCFGWIDGLKKSLDNERYTYRFTPRRPNSQWSERNIGLAKQLIADGKMASAGLNAFEHKKPYDKRILKALKAKEIPLTPKIAKWLRANKKAWENFNNLAPSYKKHYAGWLRSAKREETLERRLKKAIELLEKNEKLGMT